jgi:imidazolonepropionase-like amidohydrolase
MHDLSAQDLTITNARIIVGNGTVINQGSLVIRGGRIASVAPGAPSASAGQTLDAKGMTMMPGFIDAHRHINTGPTEQARMQEFLEAGYTTLMSGGGPAEGNIELKKHVESGTTKGPRIITSGRVDSGNFKTPDAARAEVRRLSQLGIDIIKVAIDPKPSPASLEILAATTDEAKKVKLDVMVHAVSGPAMIAAVKAGATKLVHTPHFGWLTEADAKVVQEAGVEMLSTIGFGVPVFGVYNQDNVPTFRDGKPWPAAIIDGEGRGREAGYKAVNARTLWDAGVSYGFGTDTGYLPKLGLAHELRALNLMFSPQDIIKLMGPNTAAFIEKSKDLGTLEAGKLADIVILDGNPLEGYWNLLNAKIVIKGGQIMVDKR